MATPADSFPTLENPVQAVRRFNRFYTRQIGVLQEHLLQSEFSLTEVRVLYELAHRTGITAVELREELGLDRGYLSRMLQNFEKNGWIKTTPSRSDRRRILLSLTHKGRGVFDPLDQRSSEEVRAMLARLSPVARRNLVGAMQQIEGVLGATEQQIPRGLNPARTDKDEGSVIGANEARALPIRANFHNFTGEMPVAQRSDNSFTLRSHRPGDMGWVAQRHGELYWQEYKYDERFEALVAEIVAEFIQHFDPKRERCWIVEKDGERVGTIFLVKKSNMVAKLRLLLVEPTARGLGIGRRLVSECVNFAREAGYKKIMLWTQSELHSARHLYEQAGFKRLSDDSHKSWGRNDLVAETWGLTL
jgi:DNA-binding MarR family transcriptional regulator/GNAT superfamily N-acetyltransferase